MGGLELTLGACLVLVFGAGFVKSILDILMAMAGWLLL